jgi:formylmethanofuran dehydrogenase subunit A
MSGTLILKGGLVMDPASQTSEVMDILIRDGVVQEMGGELADPGSRALDVA